MVRGATQRVWMGRSQVVRQRILIPPFVGSIPTAPAMNSQIAIRLEQGPDRTDQVAIMFKLTGKSL